MLRNPLVHALLALLYIIAVAFVMFYAVADIHPETVFVPITVLSVFVLSAAVMGFLFLAEPIQLYLDGKKQEAVRFFLTTVLSFAILTALLIGALPHLPGPLF